uniref:Uncharacterized protein n=1 Tax=Magallana gigas TaxID=29159 RepID=K1QYR4_MAGGI
MNILCFNNLQCCEFKQLFFAAYNILENVHYSLQKPEDHQLSEAQQPKRNGFPFLICAFVPE